MNTHALNQQHRSGSGLKAWHFLALLAIGLLVFAVKSGGAKTADRTRPGAITSPKGKEGPGKPPCDFLGLDEVSHYGTYQGKKLKNPKKLTAAEHSLDRHGLNPETGKPWYKDATIFEKKYRDKKELRQLYNKALGQYRLGKGSLEPMRRANGSIQKGVWKMVVDCGRVIGKAASGKLLTHLTIIFQEVVGGKNGCKKAKPATSFASGPKGTYVVQAPVVGGDMKDVELSAEKMAEQLEDILPMQEEASGDAAEAEAAED